MKRLFRAPASYIIAGLVAVLSFSLLFLFPSRSIDPIWKGYRVLIVPVSEDEAGIVARLNNAGIISFVTESNSMIRNTTEMAPVASFLPGKNEVLLSWFRNDEQKIRYLYLEEKPFLESKVDHAFADAHFDWTIEKADSIHLVPVFLAVLFFAVLLVFCRDRLFLTVSGLSFLLCVFTCNQYSAFLVSITALYGIFVLERLLEPRQSSLTAKQRIVRLRKNPFVLLPWFIVLFILPFGGFPAALLFVASLGVAIPMLYLAISARNGISAKKELKRFHPSFRPNLMHPDSIGKKTLEKIELLLIAPIPVLGLCAFFLFDGLVMPEQKQAQAGRRELYIPSPTGYTDRTGFDTSGYASLSSLRKNQAYPDLAWFISVRWNLETAPWRRVQEAFVDPVPGATANCMEYEAGDDGKISGKKDTIMTFDSNFIRKTLSGPITPLEKMLVSQGRFASVNLSRHSK
jgi:hypothetical protein